LPAVVLAIARPELTITAVESLQKRVTFVRHVSRELRLPIIVEPVRLEQRPEAPTDLRYGRLTCDLRAVRVGHARGALRSTRRSDLGHALGQTDHAESAPRIRGRPGCGARHRGCCAASRCVRSTDLIVPRGTPVDHSPVLALKSSRPCRPIRWRPSAPSSPR
jgi:hypothetical protein